MFKRISLSSSLVVFLHIIPMVLITYKQFQKGSDLHLLYNFSSQNPLRSERNTDRFETDGEKRKNNVSVQPKSRDVSKSEKESATQTGTAVWYYLSVPPFYSHFKSN